MIAKFKGSCKVCGEVILPGDNIVAQRLVGASHRGCVVRDQVGADDGYDAMRDRWLENGGGFGAPKPWRS